jgi:transcriptional regulator with XRE-family HTH domain
MDDVAMGRLLRSTRVRLRLRQVDVATRAGISQQLVSVVELGALEHVSIPALRRLGRAVGAEIVIGVRWRGACLTAPPGGARPAPVMLVSDDRVAPKNGRPRGRRPTASDGS